MIMRITEINNKNNDNENTTNLYWESYGCKLNSSSRADATTVDNNY